MFENYIKTAFRNLRRHRVFSVINLLGLAMGMASCQLIFLYISFEWNWDRFNEKKDRIYRVIADTKTATETIHTGTSSSAIGPQLKRDFSQVQEQTRLLFPKFLVANGQRKFQENEILYADSSVFQVFSFPLLEGDPASALKTPFSAVLSQTAAQKYFGKEDPMGKTLTLDNRFLVKVTGVMKDIPENAHFRTDIFLSLTTVTQKFNPGWDQNWQGFDCFTYVLLAPGVKQELLQHQFPGFMERHAGGGMRQSQIFYTLFLQPLADIHLGRVLNNYGLGTPTGNKTDLYVLSIIAVFILLIASINFVNLTTARASERAKEVGIRKIVGALRGQLTLQFLGESILLCLLACLLAIGLCLTLLPLFDQISGKHISLYILGHGVYLWVLLGLALIIGGIAGIYPALILSGFRPIAVLKGSFVSGRNGLLLRKGLVVFQFTVSIALIAGTLIVFNQLHFMRGQELGFRKDQMMLIKFYGDTAVQNKATSLKEAMASLPFVKGISFSNRVPGQSPDNIYTKIETPGGEMRGTNPNEYAVDFDFLQQYGISLVAGRGFSRDFPTDSTKAMMINEAVSRSLGYQSPEAAIGKRIQQGDIDGVIIGVMRDFHYQSLQQAIQPLVLRVAPYDWKEMISVQISGDHIPQAVKALEQTWKSLEPQLLFDYSFADEDFDRLYVSEERFGKLFLYLSILAIFISCLGLLGLASYSTIQRTKEVGIRKVLGASVSSIMAMLSQDFLRLVCIALVIAAPLSWWFMHRWLMNFAYRTDINGWVYVQAGGVAFLIALLTVSYYAVKTAMANPIRNLRTE